MLGDTTSTDGIIKFTTSVQAVDSSTNSLTLTSGAGTITLPEIGGSSNPLTTFVATSNALTISSDITTTGLIDINAPITLGADVVLSSGTGAGDIELGSSVLGPHNLDISSGSGAVTITVDVGAEASKALTTLDINNGSETGNVTLTGNIGTASLSGAGAVNIGNNGLTGTITFGGTDYNTTGAQTYIADAYSMTGANPDFNTDDDNISFEDGDNGITLATFLI